MEYNRSDIAGDSSGNGWRVGVVEIWCSSKRGVWDSMGLFGCRQLCLTPGPLCFVQTSPQATAPAFGGHLRQASWMSAASGAVIWEGWRCTVLPWSLRNQPALSVPSATLTCPRLRRYVCVVGMQSFLSVLSYMGGGVRGTQMEILSYVS